MLTASTKQIRRGGLCMGAMFTAATSRTSSMYVWAHSSGWLDGWREGALQSPMAV